MAIVWGDRVWASAAAARLGVEVTDPNGNGRPVRAQVWLEVRWGVVDSSFTLTVGGTHPDTSSQSVSNTAGSTNRYLLRTVDYDYERVHGEARSGTVSATLTDFVIGSPTVSVPWRLETLSYQAPAMPTSVSASRVDDKRAAITWGGAPTTAAPISGFAVQRNRKWSTGYEGWEHITSLPATARSYTDSTLGPDMAYKYRVRAEGPGGQSEFVETGEVYTSPLAPGSAWARRDGADIVISVVHRSRFPSNIEVWEGDTRVGTIFHPETTFRVTGADPMVPHTYRLRAALDGLYSSWVKTNPVRLAAAPFAPDGLYPNGGWQEAGRSVTLGWVHNPADGSAQTAYQVRYRQAGTSTWTTLAKSTSSAQSRNITFPLAWAGAEWQVMTWGQDPDKPSPWSNIASFELAAKPSFTIVSPTAGQLVETETLTVVLSTPVVDGLWEIQIRKNGGMVDSARGTGGGTIEWTVHELQNLDDLTVHARVADKVWSDWKQVAFHVRYAAPAQPVLDAAWEPDNASALLTVTNPAGTMETVSNRVQRRLDGGTWETISADIGVGGSITDPLPPLNGRVEYRAVAVSATGTTSMSDPASPGGEAPPCAYYLNWGAGWGETARIRYNPDRAITTGLAYHELYHFAGQSKPTAHAGIGTSETSRISGTLTPTDKAVDHVLLANRLADLGKTPGVRVSLRSPDRRTVFGSVTGVTISQGEAGRYTVELTHTESD